MEYCSIFFLPCSLSLQRFQEIDDRYPNIDLKTKLNVSYFSSFSYFIVFHLSLFRLRKNHGNFGQIRLSQFQLYEQYLFIIYTFYGLDKYLYGILISEKRRLSQLLSESVDTKNNCIFPFFFLIVQYHLRKRTRNNRKKYELCINAILQLKALQVQYKYVCQLTALNILFSVNKEHSIRELFTSYFKIHLFLFPQ